MGFQKSQGYSELRTSDEWDSGLFVERTAHTSLTRRLTWYFVRLTGFVVFLILYTLATVAVMRSYSGTLEPLAYSSSWADNLPSQRDQLVQFNGSLDWPSPYRGTPSREIDKAWEALIPTGPLSLELTAADVDSLGVSEETVARLPSGEYFLQLEFVHQLHCVNFLRKATHREYYNTRTIEFTDSEPIVRMHLDHCIEMLRQIVMCDADTNLLTSHWVKGRSSVYSDFNVLHQCRDFDAVMEWYMDHQSGLQSALHKPPGAKQLPEDP